LKEAKGEPQTLAVNNRSESQENEVYRLDCRTGDAVPLSEGNATFNPHWKEEEEGGTFVVREDGSDSSSVEDGADVHMPDNSLIGTLREGDDDADSHSSDAGHDANDAWDEGYDGKFSRNESMEEGDEESEDEGTALNPEHMDDDAHPPHGLTKMEGGKEQYYCKYCDTAWPYNHFRNAQQFGAHCSNCSRKRKVKDPQELTIRERNKRLRKSKKPSSGHSDKKKHRPARHSLEQHGPGPMEFDDEEGEDGPASEGDSISVLQRAAIASVKDWGQGKGQTTGRETEHLSVEQEDNAAAAPRGGGAEATAGARESTTTLPTPLRKTGMPWLGIPPCGLLHVPRGGVEATP